jgi:hypothetical protein
LAITRPARYFSENAATLWPQVSDATKDRRMAANSSLQGRFVLEAQRETSLAAAPRHLRARQAAR